MQVGPLNIEFGLHFDALSLLMLLIVTGVGAAIHIYSIGYMKGDPAYARFFACMSLFTFSMLGVVVSNNFFQMFIFWELVGLSSYLLIGFWYERASAADAAKKAFLTNRAGRFWIFHRHRSGLGGGGHFELRRDERSIGAQPGICSTRPRPRSGC